MYYGGQQYGKKNTAGGRFAIESTYQDDSGSHVIGSRARSVIEVAKGTALSHIFNLRRHFSFHFFSSSSSSPSPSSEESGPFRSSHTPTYLLPTPPSSNWHCVGLSLPYLHRPLKQNTATQCHLPYYPPLLYSITPHFKKGKHPDSLSLSGAKYDTSKMYATQNNL